MPMFRALGQCGACLALIFFSFPPVVGPCLVVATTTAPSSVVVQLGLSCRDVDEVVMSDLERRYAARVTAGLLGALNATRMASPLDPQSNCDQHLNDTEDDFRQVVIVVPLVVTRATGTPLQLTRAQVILAAVAAATPGPGDGPDGADTAANPGGAPAAVLMSINQMLEAVPWPRHAVDETQGSGHAAAREPAAHAPGDPRPKKKGKARGPAAHAPGDPRPKKKGKAKQPKTLKTVHHARHAPDNGASPTRGKSGKKAGRAHEVAALQVWPRQPEDDFSFWTGAFACAGVAGEWRQGRWHRACPSCPPRVI